MIRPTRRTFRLIAIVAAAVPVLILGAFAPAELSATPEMQETEAEHALAQQEHAEQETAGAGQDDHAEQDDHAAQGEHADEEEHAEEPKPWYYWPAKWINFLLLAGLLYWMLVIPPKPVQDIFSFSGLRVIFAERASGIIAARDLAAEQKQEASRMLADSEQRLAKISEEVAALVSDARADAESEKGRALEEGKAQAEKVIEVAQREVRQERVTAQRQLRRFVADLAVSLAETNLAEHLTPDDQDRLIREYLSRLDQSMA